MKKKKKTLLSYETLNQIVRICDSNDKNDFRVNSRVEAEYKKVTLSKERLKQILGVMRSSYFIDSYLNIGRCAFFLCLFYVNITISDELNSLKSNLDKAKSNDAEILISAKYWLTECR